MQRLRMFSMVQYWLRKLGPAIFSALTNIFYRSPNVQIGRELKADGVPRILVDEDASVSIGDNVEFRRGVELRSHSGARIEIGDRCRIDRGVRILATNGARVRIGAGCRIGLYSVLNGGASIEIGESALLSGFVYLQTSQHRFAVKDKPIKDQGYTHGEVKVGDGAWLAAHVVVMPGVSVGQNAVVGSNAVVTKSVEADVVVGGIPAKPLSQK